MSSNLSHQLKSRSAFHLACSQLCASQSKMTTSKRPIHDLLADSDGDDEPIPLAEAAASSEPKIQKKSQAVPNLVVKQKAQVGHTAWIGTLKEIYAGILMKQESQKKPFRLQTGCTGTGAAAICMQAFPCHECLNRSQRCILCACVGKKSGRCQCN